VNVHACMNIPHTYIHAYIPYYTIPYHTIPYHTIPYHTIQGVALVDEHESMVRRQQVGRLTRRILISAGGMIMFVAGILCMYVCM